MYAREINLFLQRVGLGAVYEEGRPFALNFAANKYRICFDVSEKDQDKNELIVSLEYKLPEYDLNKFIDLLKEHSFLNQGSINFSVGFNDDKVILLTRLPINFDSYTLENTVGFLLKTVQERGLN